MKQAIRIIGIDPGTRFTGVGVIESESNKLKFLHSVLIKTEKIKSMEDKLLVINRQITEVVKEFMPTEASIEKIFHSVNPKTTLLLGHARGVVMFSLKVMDLDIFEYSPTEVKSALVGGGRADKHQVQAMVKILLNLNKTKEFSLDESDALAIAICHANSKTIRSFQLPVHK